MASQRRFTFTVRAFSTSFSRFSFVGRPRMDFVGDFVAGAFEGAPHIPACDSAVGPPALAEFEQLFGLGHVLFAIGDGPALFHAGFLYAIRDRAPVGRVVLGKREAGGWVLQEVL